MDGKSSANPPVEIEQNNGNDQRLKQVLEAKFYKSNGDHKLRISSGSLSRHPFLQRSGLFQCLKDFNGVSCLPYIMYTDNVRPVYLRMIVKGYGTVRAPTHAPSFHELTSSISSGSPH